MKNPQAGPEATTLRIHHLQVLGQKFRVAVRPGSGVPLLLFNGVGAGLEHLLPFVQRLEGREAIVFDAPGTGESPLPRMPYRPAFLAQQVAGLLDQLGYTEVDVLGISWGGLIAQQFAFQFAQRCRRLVLVSTGSSLMPQGAGRDMSAARAELMEIRGDRPVGWSEPIGIGSQMMAVMGWSSRLWLPRLSQPTLILAGEKDAVMPVANGKRLHALIPHSTLHVLDGKHALLSMNGPRCAELVSAFLQADDAEVRTEHKEHKARAPRGWPFNISALHAA